MPAESAGVAIPANVALSQAERNARREALFFPYHDTIGRLIDARLGAGRPTMLLALHSFTPDYPGEIRPWHVGVTHRADRGLGSLMVDLLRQRTDLCVGDNQPYRIDDFDDVTIPVHGERRDLPNVLIELRQDTLATAHGIAETAEWLSAALDRAAGMVLAWSRPDQRF
jgi:predicted N-formylglutamate amidohydrolase